MTFSRIVITVLFGMTMTSSYANSLDDQLQSIFQSHYSTFKEKEYYSAATLSVSLPNQPIKNFYAGQLTRDKNSAPVNSTTLFQIGSITKSFTSAVLLQLEKEKK